MRILIVEPDEYYHEQFRESIGAVAELVFSRNSREAIGSLNDGDYQFVITELLLADGHAYDLFPKLRNIPVIVYTKIPHLEDVEASLNYGITGYFIKGQDSINDIKKLILVPELLNT